MQNPNFKELFKQIAEEKNFDQLEQFIIPEIWDEMEHDDRELLALLFIIQGEHHLKEKPKNAGSSFRLAEKISPKKP